MSYCLCAVSAILFSGSCWSLISESSDMQPMHAQYYTPGACPGFEERRCWTKRAQSAHAKLLAMPSKRWPRPSSTHSWRQLDDREGCFRPSSDEKLPFRASPVSLMLVLGTSCCLLVVTQLLSWLLCQTLHGLGVVLEPPDPPPRHAPAHYYTVILWNVTVVPPQCVHDCPASLYYVGHAQAGLNYGCRSTVCYCYSYWHTLLQLLGMLVQCTGYVLQFEGCLPLISLSHAHLEHIPVHLICINLRAKQQHSRRHNICLLTYTMPVVHMST